MLLALVYQTGNWNVSRMIIHTRLHGKEKHGENEIGANSKSSAFSPLTIFLHLQFVNQKYLLASQVLALPSQVHLEDAQYLLIKKNLFNKKHSSYPYVLYMYH